MFLSTPQGVEGRLGIAPPILNHGARPAWVINITPRPPGKNPGTHCIEDWAGRGASLDFSETRKIPYLGRDSNSGSSSQYCSPTKRNKCFGIIGFLCNGTRSGVMNGNSNCVQDCVIANWMTRKSAVSTRARMYQTRTPILFHSIQMQVHNLSSPTYWRCIWWS